MVLHTKRLDLIPLTWKELEFLTTNTSILEKNLGYFYDGEEINKELRRIMVNQIPTIKQDIVFYELHTFWMIILRSKSTIIGSICFKGRLTEEKSLEVGYGLNLKYRKKGYMSETLETFSKYGLTKLGAEKIIAQTLRTNEASQNTLKRTGFKLVKSTAKYYWFELH